MDILVTGDVHGAFKRLNALINKYKHRLDLIICCGDFGYWPSHSDGHMSIKTYGIPLLWCDGNHEDHWALQDRTSNEIVKDVFYMPRGSTYNLKDGRTIMFIGGADSIDKEYRTLGIDWFPDEVITQKDLMNLPDIKVDIFITHTCPLEIHHILARHYEKEKEPSNHALSSLWQIYKPDLWIFGHWHYYHEGKIGDTKWYALSCVNSDTRWWMWMP